MNRKILIVGFLVICAISVPIPTKAMNQEERLVHEDVANQHMNELILTKEYKEKFKKQIIVPSYFPFKITHVSGKIAQDKLTLDYKNVNLTSLLKIQAGPTDGEILLPKGNLYKPVALDKGYNGYFGKMATGYELIFLHNNIQYNVKLIDKDRKYKPSKNELKKVANSMIFFMEP